MNRDEFSEALDAKFEEWMGRFEHRFVTRDLCNERTGREENRAYLIYGAYTFTAVAFATLVSWLVFK